jgi:beta-glucanase (GH16 family)
MTTRNIKITAILVTAAITALSYPGHFKNKGAVKTTSENIVFFDDFNQNALDRTKWNVELTHHITNNEQQAYIDSSATIYLVHGAEAEGAKNALVIKPVFCPHYTTKEGNTFDFLSGRLNTRGKAEFTYGTMAARMKLPAGSGFWPAFWALGAGKWPECGEIDIMENVGETDWVSAAIHGPGYFGETPIVNKVFLDQKNDVTQWHIYSVDWDQNSMLFKVDGTLFYRVTRPMIENYGNWVFDSPKFLILNLALGGAYPAKTNGVKKPYNGLPQMSVDDIKAGKAKVLVDWVKVTK